MRPSGLLEWVLKWDALDSSLEDGPTVDPTSSSAPRVAFASARRTPRPRRSAWEALRLEPVHPFGLARRCRDERLCTNTVRFYTCTLTSAFGYVSKHVIDARLHSSG